MRLNLTRPTQWFTAVLLLAIGLSSYGCSDTASVSEDVDVPLSSLRITPGSLSPSFFANTTNYRVNAPTSATTVTVTAIPKDNTATVTINGTITTQQSVNLGAPGSITTITILVESQTGGETTYTVNVTRLLSSDNNLSALSVTQGALNPSPFNANTVDYTVDVATNVDSVTVSATKSDTNAVMSGSLTAGPGVATGQATIPLGGPGTATPVTITVTAPNGSAKTYRITVNRLSDDNNLSALTVTPGTWDPNNPFNPNTSSYTVDVATHVTQVIVSATKSDSNATLAIGSVIVPPGTATGQAPITLNGAGTPTSISITVTAANGNPRQPPYTITVNRAAPAAPPAPASAPDMTPQSDSGVSNTDNITNVTMPSFTVALPAAGETPNLYVDGSIAKQGFDLGANTLTPTTPLTDGIHTITSTVTSSAGLESSQSPSLIIIIDTAAPVSP